MINKFDLLVFFCVFEKGFKVCVNDYMCVFNCVRVYMKCYIGGSGCLVNCESYVWIYNGGLWGCWYLFIFRYWEKVY